MYWPDCLPTPTDQLCSIGAKSSSILPLSHSINKLITLCIKLSLQFLHRSFLLVDQVIRPYTCPTGGGGLEAYFIDVYIFGGVVKRVNTTQNIAPYTVWRDSNGDKCSIYIYTFIRVCTYTGQNTPGSKGYVNCPLYQADQRLESSIDQQFLPPSL